MKRTVAGGSLLDLGPLSWIPSAVGICDACSFHAMYESVIFDGLSYAQDRTRAGKTTLQTEPRKWNLRFTSEVILASSSYRKDQHSSSATTASTMTLRWQCKGWLRDLGELWWDWARPKPLGRRPAAHINLTGWGEWDQHNEPQADILTSIGIKTIRQLYKETKNSIGKFGNTCRTLVVSNYKKSYELVYLFRMTAYEPAAALRYGNYWQVPYKDRLPHCLNKSLGSRT